MRLSVHWQHPTRPTGIQYTVEALYSQRLMELYGSPENAAKDKEDFMRNHRPPFHTWHTYNLIASEEATQDLLPSERKQAHFTVEFEP